MNRKMYWGIASLILIIGVVGVYFMLQPKPDTEPEKKFIVPSEADLVQAKDVNQQQRPVSKAVKPPPPGASPNRHWHDAPHADVVPSHQVVTDAQKADWEKFWKKQGLDPPPEGHGYWYNNDGTVGGLFKYNEPRFKTGWSETLTAGQDFSKLTEMEWIRYQALRHIVGGSVLEITQEMLKQLKDDDPVPKATYAPGVQELARAWKSELRHKASGPTPKVSVVVTWNRDATPKELEEIERKSDALMESLKRPKRPFPEWQPYVETIVKELEAAIAAE